MRSPSWKLMKSICLLAVAVGISKTAQAQEAPITADIQMLRPTFAGGGAVGVDTPYVLGRGASRYGVFVQYERDPVVLYQYGDEWGVAVKNRTSTYFGASVDFNQRFSMRAAIPLALSIGSDQQVSAFANEGLGIGDFMLGARAVLADTGPLTLGARADLYLPIGTNNAYLGDPSIRGQFGLNAGTQLGPVRLGAELSYLARPDQVETAQDFTLESTLGVNAGAQYDVWADHLGLQLSYLSQGGVSFLGKGGAENASEMIAGLYVFNRRDNRIDIGVGKGIAPGVGTTAARIVLAYTVITPPIIREPEPEPVVVQLPPPPPPEPDIVFIEEEPEPEWEPEEKAKIVGDQVVIREPVQFDYATADILEESMPTLQAVANILNEHAEIEHLVIEGHASVEGSFEYNYELSNERARSIWKELMAYGVHPSRISYRGMGEVVPVAQGESEEALAKNRRVEFDIVDRVEEGEDYPIYPDSYLLPWSGTEIETIQPVVPEPVVEETEKELSLEEQLNQLLDPDDFDEDALDDTEPQEEPTEESP